MILGNRFKTEDKFRLWTGRDYCHKCGGPENCSLHHITGCKHEHADSILNSIMLCHKCHKIADGHNVGDVEFQRPLVEKTIRIAKEEYYEFVKRDFGFINYCYNNKILLQ